MGKRPTEEDLGIDLTAEEQEVLARPVTQQPEDDIPQSETDENDTLVQGKPKAEPSPAGETDEAKATRERDEQGKFVATPKDGEAPKVETPPADERKVDLRALQEARAENKILMERMTALLEVQQRREAAKAQAEAPTAPVIPKWDADPLSAGQWTQDQLLEIKQRLDQKDSQQQAWQLEQQETDQAYAIANPQFAEAAATDPTMLASYSGLRESFAREIAFNAGIPFDTATPQQQQYVRAEIDKLEAQHVKYAVSTRQNVADYVRGLARARGVNPQAALPTAAPQGQAVPAKTIAERQEAQSRHLSLGDLPGGAAPTSVSAKDLAKMSQKDFNAFMKRMGDAGADEMFLKAQLGN